MENRTAFMEYRETIVNLTKSREYKEAITQQHQEAVQRISFGIQWRAMEYQEAFMQYDETCYGIPRSFYGIPNYQEALSNTMKLDGIPRGFDENLV